MDPGRGHDAQDGSPPEERPAKRHRSAVACQRCKNRKQRCNNEFPSCSNCVAAGELCAYGGKQIYPAQYVRSLESHIAHLERSMASADPNMATDHFASTPGRRGYDRQHNQPVTAESPEDAAVSGNTWQPSLEMGVGFVAMSPNSFLGTSSGFPLAKLVKSAINVTSRSSPRRDGLEHRESPAYASAQSSSTTLPAAPSHREGGNAAKKADMPSDDVAESLIDAYFSKVHPKHPFLSKSRIAALNKSRTTLVPAHQMHSSNNRGDRLDHAILHLVYAIGARYLQLANDHSCSPPEVNNSNQ
ncbi:Zn(2)-C6 fungal-type DNA-binding domain protein [Niveomyces insectorum RCEF 264]|uniref:Zn(2)-C6 fungal-type DNA-binding domain protein n=1 Tax=Niveomyces insectorum RCEF 264 TaxID=1081102 RepID=A0A167MHV5_9HYPO|nr:Zn(2)-C6 fungal-type DNA-binding domain protein [Niveomyces insectorum RCEF 264]